MKHAAGGNGSGKFEIHHQDMGGWVRVFADRDVGLSTDLPVYLSSSLMDWFRQRPHLRLRSAVSVQRNGDTVELHAWYDAHLFPPLAGPTPDTTKKG
jgi:hypothetical protein